MRAAPVFGFLLAFVAVFPGRGRGGEVAFRDGLGGKVRQVTVAPDDSLIEIARRYDVGFNEIAAANPGVDAYVPEVGSRVVVPGAWILPDVPIREGILINLSELRLYRFPDRGGSAIETYPIGIGREAWATPAGTFRVVERIVRPAWHVPDSIRKEKPELPAVVPPGPDNPLGTHALRLSLRSVLIHGTDRPFGIGRRVSHGCIHLYPEDIPKLFRGVMVGTRVTIVAQPVKAALRDGRVWVQVHGEDEDEASLAAKARAVLDRKGLTGRVDPERLREALRERSGLPVDVTRKGPPEPVAEAASARTS